MCSIKRRTGLSRRVWIKSHVKEEQPPKVRLPEPMKAIWAETSGFTSCHMESPVSLPWHIVGGVPVPNIRGLCAPPFYNSFCSLKEIVWFLSSSLDTRIQGLLRSLTYGILGGLGIGASLFGTWAGASRSSRHPKAGNNSPRGPPLPFPLPILSKDSHQSHLSDLLFHPLSSCHRRHSEAFTEL